MAKATFSPAAQFNQALISVKQITVIECCWWQKKILILWLSETKYLLPTPAIQWNEDQIATEAAFVAARPNNFIVW